MKIAIFIGSNSDYEVVKEALEIIKEFRDNINYCISSLAQGD